MAKTFHRQLAEDLTSEVFLTAYEAFEDPARHIRDREKYLYGIMKYVWLAHLRQKYAQTAYSVEQIDDFSKYAQETLDEVRSQSLVERALPYIERLPEAQRRVMLLRFRDGLDLKAITGQLGKDMNYVKTTQRRGLASLRALIEKGDVA